MAICPMIDDRWPMIDGGALARRRILSPDLVERRQSRT